MEIYKLPYTTRILVAILIIMFPVGVIIMLSGALSGEYLWTTNIFLGLQALITVLLLKKTAKHSSVVFVTVMIFVLSFLTELIGVKTGIPFGRYEYSQTLSPLLFGVPIAITFAWFVLSVNSYLLARYFFGKSARIYAVVSAAFLVLGIDMLLEPFASHVNGYWIWENGRIPFHNYVSWFMLGFVFSFLIDRFTRWSDEVFSGKQIIVIPSIVLLVNIIQFSIINVYHNYLALTITGLLIIGTVMYLGIKLDPNGA